MGSVPICIIPCQTVRVLSLNPLHRQSLCGRAYPRVFCLPPCRHRRAAPGLPRHPQDPQVLPASCCPFSNVSFSFHVSTSRSSSSLALSSQVRARAWEKSPCSGNPKSQSWGFVSRLQHADGWGVANAVFSETLHEAQHRYRCWSQACAHPPLTDAAIIHLRLKTSTRLSLMNG